MYIGKNKTTKHNAHCGNPCNKADLKKNLQGDTRTFHDETRDKPETDSSQVKGKSVTKCHWFKCKNSKKRINFET